MPISAGSIHRPGERGNRVTLCHLSRRYRDFTIRSRESEIGSSAASPSGLMVQQPLDGGPRGQLDLPRRKRTRRGPGTFNLRKKAKSVESAPSCESEAHQRQRQQGEVPGSGTSSAADLLRRRSRNPRLKPERGSIFRPSNVATTQSRRTCAVVGAGEAVSTSTSFEQIAERHNVPSQLHQVACRIAYVDAFVERYVWGSGEIIGYRPELGR